MPVRGRVMISLGCSWKPWDWDDCVHKYLGEALNGVIGSLFKFVFDAIKSVVVAAVKAMTSATARR